MKCEKCNLHLNAENQVIPRGSDNPLIYFIGEAPGFEEDREGVPFVGRSGKRLDKTLEALKITDQVRIFNPVRCVPIDENNKLRKPTPEEIKCCEHHLITDVNNTKPKVVVSLGAVPAQYLLGDSFTTITALRGKVLSVDIGGVNYQYIPTFHPSYLLRKSASVELSAQFDSDIENAHKLAISGKDTQSFLTRNMVIEKALDYSTFKKFYSDCLVNEEQVAFDVETNSLEPYTEGSKIIGFSFATRGKGIYVCFESLDYVMHSDDKKSCEKLMLHLLKTRKIVVHNSVFERGFVLSQHGYELPFETVDDTLMMSRLMMGGRVSSRLKFQCVTNLGYHDWDEDLNVFRSNFGKFIDTVHMSSRSDYKELVEKSGIVKFLDKTKDDLKTIKKDEDKKKLKSLITSTEKFLSVVNKYYPENHLYNGILEKLVSLVPVHNSETLNFSHVPERILSDYGAIDSIATFDLYDYYIEKMEKDSTEDVQLLKGYKVYLEHAYLGYLFERNGAYWNDEVATEDEHRLNNLCVSHLKNVVTSPILKDYLTDSLFFEYCSDILISDYPVHLKQQGINIIQDTYKGEPVLKIYDLSLNKKSHIKQLEKKFSIPDEIKDELREKVYKVILSKAKECNDIDSLKEFYNPNSSTKEAKQVLENLLITTDIRLAYFILYLNVEILGRGKVRNIDNVYGSIDRRVLKLAQKMGVIFAQDEPDYSLLKVLFEKVKNLMSENKVVTIHLETAHGKSLNYELESTDDGSIIKIYNLYRLTGIDPDDPASWNVFFRWIVDFRTFKKAFKLVSTYINGTVGRESVKVVDKKALTSGDTLVMRKRNYSPLSNDEDYLLDTSFGINTAVTGRWRSFMHVLPPSPKKYFTSRFTGGTILQPDYSQMEVRVLAYEAQEKQMLEAFKRGEDIHTYVAQQIYKRDTVTDAERKFAKGATFSIIYGATEYAFAMDYCGGDRSTAKKIFKLFFENFPQIKEYINLKHGEREAYGKVSLPTVNSFINIETRSQRKDEDQDTYQKVIEQAKRFAQNYPIQGTASGIVGSVFFDVCQYLIEKGYKSKPFLFTHDSDEIDVYPFELIDLIVVMSRMLNEIPLEKYSTPCHAEISLGKSFGHELVASDIEVNETLTYCSMKLKGYKEDLYETVDNWKQAYRHVKVYDEKWKTEYTSIGANFLPKRAYNIYAGSEREKGTAIVKLKY